VVKAAEIAAVGVDKPAGGDRERLEADAERMLGQVAEIWKRNGYTFPRDKWLRDRLIVKPDEPTPKIMDLIDEQLGWLRLCLMNYLVELAAWEADKLAATATRATGTALPAVRRVERPDGKARAFKD
jgi:hypothetical protein